MQNGDVAEFRFQTTSGGKATKRASAVADRSGRTRGWAARWRRSFLTGASPGALTAFEQKAPYRRGAVHREQFCRELEAEATALPEEERRVNR